MRMQCLSCGATYDTVQADGTEYYHACAPLSVPELRAGLADGSIKLPARQAAELAAIDKRGAATDADPNAPPPGDVYLAQLTIERPNKRDENVRSDPANGKVGMRAHGAGAIEVVDEA